MSASSSSSVKHSHVILEDFNRKVTEYYETKKQFEDEINQILENKRVKGQKLDRKERKTIKIGKCVVCKFPGMTFTNTKEELRIQCNTNPTCRANQVIRKPVFENVETQMYQVILGSLVKLLSFPTLAFLLKGGKGGFAKI